MTDPKKKPSPGGLSSSDTYILLHTRQALNVFDGRDKTEEKSAIFGVPRFAGSVDQIYRDSRADDPWADWWLVKIDEHLERANEKLNEYQQELEKLYPRSRNINISNSESSKPQPRPLEFGTPSYPYRMSYLVVDYDDFCCKVRGLMHQGLITRGKGERYLNLGGKPIRAALQSGTGYRHQGVTRNDVMANNPKSQKAKLLMGEVPHDILEMKRRSEYAPVLRQYDLPEKDISEESTIDTAEPSEKIKVIG
jgi:integrating conjugative element protein (TIGR03761 family)